MGTSFNDERRISLFTLAGLILDLSIVLLIGIVIGAIGSWHMAKKHYTRKFERKLKKLSAKETV